MPFGRTQVNKSSFSYTPELSLGVLPGSPVWSLVEPNANISKWGSETKVTPRDPISKLKQRRKGEITDLDSSVEMEFDLTCQSLRDFAPGMFSAKWKGPLQWLPQEGNAPTAIAATSITVPNIGSALVQGTLVIVKGSLLGNNKVFVVGAGSTTTSIVIAGGIVEALPANASVEVCGVQATVSGDIQINASGNLIATTLNFTLLGLNPGQFISLGDQSNANFMFASSVPATGVNYGLARVDGIAAGVLTLSHRSGLAATWTTDAGAGKTIRIMFGRWIRNVPVDHADYLETSYQFERTSPDLGGVGVPYYDYAVGNYLDTWELDLPLTNKATVKATFKGQITQAPGTTRATNAANAIIPTQTGELSSQVDIARLRVFNTDESGLTTDFMSIMWKLNNNVTPEKVLAVLGAKYMNLGNFEVDLDADLLFTNFDVITAILVNRTVMCDHSLKNADGGYCLDLPSLTIGDGKPSFPKNETVHVAAKGMSFIDAVLSYSSSLSLFPYLP